MAFIKAVCHHGNGSSFRPELKCLLNNCFLCVEGVVEGDLAAVEAYKSSGGDIARQLSSDEVRLLNRPSAFDDGFTLVHLAIRFQRQDMLAVLLTEVRRHPLQFYFKVCVSAGLLQNISEGNLKD